jgi:hypothetical protein
MNRLKKPFLTIFSFALIVSLSAFTPNAWNHLGTKKVGFGIDHDRIMVTAAEGSFTKLRMDVTGQLNVHKVLVTYGNGSKERLDVKCHFGVRGVKSRVVDLKGRNRVIRHIDFWYDTKNRARKRATVRVFGLR